MDFGILGSDSEEEMNLKSDFIAALKLVHQQEGIIALSESDLPRYAPVGTQQTVSSGATGSMKNITIVTANSTANPLKLKKKERHPTAAMETFEFNDQDDQTRINTSITKKSQ